MRSLEDQIANKCIHFNGVMSDICKAGIKYADVRVDLPDEPYKFPCLKQAGECSCAEFPSKEDVQKTIDEIEISGLKVTNAIAAIKARIKETKQIKGVIPCECGGELHYRQSSYNRHIGGQCSSCKMSFQE